MQPPESSPPALTSSVSSLLRDDDSGTAGEDQPRPVLTLVLADPHPLTVEGLCRLFEKEPGCAVLAVCSEADTAFEAIRKHSPSVLVLDVEFPANGAFAVLRQIQQEGLATHVVLLATTMGDDRVLDAVRLGARGLVLKEMPPEVLVRCVRAVHAGERWPEQQALRRSLGGLLSQETAVRHLARGLTPRETEVVRLAIRGVPTKEIAVRLAVRRGTVKVHLHNIYDKLQVEGRLGLILFARRQGLV
jgi:two-component system, NarL family, nitrate/nitrite response regulator NarL